MTLSTPIKIIVACFAVVASVNTFMTRGSETSAGLKGSARKLQGVQLPVIFKGQVITDPKSLSPIAQTYFSFVPSYFSSAPPPAAPQAGGTTTVSNPFTPNDGRVITPTIVSPPAVTGAGTFFPGTFNGNRGFFSKAVPVHGSFISNSFSQGSIFSP
jgi:hypothetical protein